MVRIINIDTKTRTIRVSNGKDDLEWFTTDTGSHVPLKKGQSKSEAIKEHFGDKKSNPQLERLEKMGKAWGKDQMSFLRELGKTNPQGLKDELDRIDAERERTTKAHREWLKKGQSKAEAIKEHFGSKSDSQTAKTDKEETTYEYAKDKVALTGKQLMDKEGYSPVAYSGTVYKEDRQDFHPYYLAKGDGHHIKISKEEYHKLNEYRHERLKEWAKKMRGEV